VSRPARGTAGAPRSLRAATSGVLGLVGLLVLGGWAAPPGTPAGPSLTWERAFPVDRAPVDVHLSATFTGSDRRPHRLELWRHGTSFLHRRTDDVLDLFVVARSARNEYRYRFFDQRRHLVTDVRRDNLYRIGVYSDWFGLAHVVDRPKSAFEVRAIADPHPSSPRRDCVWRVLATRASGAPAGAGARSQPMTARVCWSARWAVPLAIEQQDPSGTWAETLSVRLVEPARFRREAVALPDPPAAWGYVDADQEIAPRAAD
jgi:hypothetical protein